MNVSPAPKNPNFAVSCSRKVLRFVLFHYFLMTLFVVALSVVVADPLLVVVTLRQAPTAVMSVEREPFRVLPAYAQLLCVRIFGVLDAVQEAFDNLRAAQVRLRLPGVVVRRPLLPAHQELARAVLLQAHLDDLLDFVLVLAFAVAVPLLLVAFIGD